jgi:glutamate/tyrosine decarboxylase-like PLP-dependent enzyme
MIDLEPDRAGRATLTRAVTDAIERFLDRLPDAPASTGEPPAAVLDRVAAAPRETPGSLDELLSVFSEAASYAVETAGGGYLAYFPAGGLLTSALAESLAATVNRYTGVTDLAPALAAMEHGVLRWLGELFGLPATAGGVLTTGASLATLGALHAARHHRLGGHDARATIYVTEHTHHCVAKAAAIAGFAPDRVRTVPTDERWRLDVAAAERVVAADAAAGLRPFLLVATAGTTSTGTVDQLTAAADLAARAGLWLHVDGAYGAAFQLTERGAALLRGIDRADSITLDPHKSLFLPYGTGALLVRDQAVLHAAHTAHGDYLRDLAGTEVPHPSDLGPELTREFRGLRLWLPLHLHGIAAFRAALDEKLDLTANLYTALAADPGVEVLAEPELSVLLFRSPAGDAATDELLRRINATREVFLSSTRIDGRLAIRLCVLSHRTHRRHVDQALRAIRAAAGILSG